MLGDTISTKTHAIRSIEYVSEDRVRVTSAEQTEAGRPGGPQYTFEANTPEEPFVPGEVITITVQRGEE